MQHDNNSSQGPLDQIYAHDPTTKISLLKSKSKEIQVQL